MEEEKKKDKQKLVEDITDGLAEAVEGLRMPTIKNGQLSDERLKEIYGEDIDDRIINDFAKISAIDFTYTPEAQNKYNDCFGMDDEKHTGVIAQELERNETTASTVKTNENGDKVVDTKELTMANTAALAELSRRVLALEQRIKEL